jgi:hypothetical protein
MAWPLSNRRRQRQIRKLAQAQLATSLSFESFLKRGIVGRFLWLFFGR